ncbi:unnamed protein product [Owenia fusiformis]|uniref:ATP-grasp domain-containing protein n=1 Tax=Owenia fusiformis TaxID=6347 RepID=A0A8S4NRH4_OWEFU|nr:unnamed protein product [Owenia fusiformis]
MEKDDENDDDNDSNDDADKNDDSSSDDGDMDDDDDDDVADTKEKPWEEENGIYGIMSRIVRTADPTLIWSVRRDSVNYKYLRNNQIVNHYARAGSFTTKVGLCTNLRNVPWFDQSDPDAFFPRCYRLSHEEEKGAFIDDYRLTACMNIIRIIISRGNNTESSETTDTTTTSSPTLKPIIQRKGSISPRRSKEHITARTRKRKGGTVPQECAELALMQCEKFLRSKDHDDLDDETEPHVLSEAEWNEFIEWYYKVVHHDAEIEGGSFYAARSENLANRLRAHWPQFEMDGTKNVWIVKPGAKSRGRGIHCHDRLEEMLRLVNSQVVRKDSKFVVQKYIERPMLVYNTKFDIRQWFIVTDWNPLTLWFYKDCYLRFCSQEFTLDDFHEAIHLSNNAIQKNYDNGIRSDKLPDENMWFHTEFKEHLSKIGRPTVWDDVIYPGMKKAILCSLLTAQDVVECRKAAFELYGADFMITEDFQPWLIEINCSPSMDTSTKVTEVLCANVLDDTIKVVIDRRSDKNCDVGQFELCYKQPAVSVPPYCGSNFSVEGQTIKPPRGFKRLQALQNLEAEAEKLKEKLSPPVSPDDENTYEKMHDRPYLRTSRFGIGKTTPAPNPKETGSLMMSKPGKIIHQLHQKPKEKPIIKVQSTSVHQFRPEPSSKSPIPVPAGGLSIERKTVPLKRSNRKSVQSTEITQQQQFETDPSKQGSIKEFNMDPLIVRNKIRRPQQVERQRIRDVKWQPRGSVGVRLPKSLLDNVRITYKTLDFHVPKIKYIKSGSPMHGTPFGDNLATTSPPLPLPLDADA